MRKWLNWPASARRKAEELYGTVVAAARNPDFYGADRVADTPEGRFELVALHLFLVAERLNGVKPEGADLVRNLIEVFVTDMDDCMREMGVGDLTVPKRVKRAAAVFYERTGTYRDALQNPGQNDQALKQALADALLSDKSIAPFTAAIATYVRAAHAALMQSSYETVANGRFTFGDVFCKD